MQRIHHHGLLNNKKRPVLLRAAFLRGVAAILESGCLFKFGEINIRKRGRAAGRARKADRAADLRLSPNQARGRGVPAPPKAETANEYDGLDGGPRLNATKEGNVSIIRIGRELYEIPDAVV